MWEQTKLFFDMGEYCVKAGTAYTPCQDYFRLAGTYAAMFLAAMGLLLLVRWRWRLRTMRQETKRLTLEHLESQQHVAHETDMQRFKWKGDSVPATNREQPELTAEIREALRTRKLGT